MASFDPDYRSMTTDELLSEHQRLEYNEDDWAIKRSARITEELERRDIFINKNRDGVFLYNEDEEGSDE